MFTLKNIKFKNILEIDELTIKKGKVTTLVGESGSGKTTLLKLFNELISPTSGVITYEGKDLKDLSPIELRREVVMLPQNPVIYPGTIQENLLIGLEFSEKPKVSNEKLREVLDFIQLRKELKEEASHLSGGEAQRLAIGRILLLDPKVFILDEPSSALDSETEERIIEKLVDYTKEQNKTLIMVTHSRKIAEKYSDEMIMIKDGQLFKEEI